MDICWKTKLLENSYKGYVHCEHFQYDFVGFTLLIFWREGQNAFFDVRVTDIHGGSQ